MQVLHYLPVGVPVNAAACLWAAEQGAGGRRWQDFALMRSWVAIRGNFCALCIPKGALFAARTPRIMHTAQILPSVAAEQRERSQARRRPYGVATCLGTAERGAGGFLSGGVAPPKECVALWGVERWRQSRHSRGGFRVGRRQGGAYQAAPPSEGRLLPVQKVVSAPRRLCHQLLRRAVRALGTSFCRAHILPRHMACCPRARSFQHSAR